MNSEKSCGAVIYRKYHGNTEILMVKHVKSGHWSFPKGHVADGETEAQTAMREIKEETGLDVLLDTGFREKVHYVPYRDINKTVVYFIARAKTVNPKPQEGEISEARWVEIDRAGALLTYDNDRVVLAKAKAFIALMK